jgi:outer membrane protein OmpA-like peptidoglycan-associated protein
MKKILLTLFVLATIHINAQQDFNNYEIKNISANTKYADFGVTFYGNNKIVFTSSNGRLLNLYVGEIENEDVKSKKIFAKSTSAKTHQTNVAFTKDLKTVYFTRSIYGKERGGKILKKETIAIFKANIDSNGNWTNEQPMPFNSDDYDVAHPTLNNQNTKLYFTSNMPGTIGDNDIFVVDINSDGTYSEPRNLGPNVNSKGKEMFPFISGDNILYFSSTGRDHNLGGLDVYRSQVTDNGVTKAIHLNKPINTRWDDFSYVYNPSTNQGFLSSNRAGGKGADDIYLFVEKKPEPVKELGPCSQKIKGTVLINATVKIIPLAEISLLNSQGKLIKKKKSGADGKFIFSNLDCNTTYFIEGNKKGYSSMMKTIKLPETKGETKLSLYLVKEKKKEIDLTTFRIGKVDFNYNEAKILKRYAYELDLAIRKLKENPNLIIEFESHTDSRAEDEFNMELTQKRIEAIKEYMGFKGIQSNRIIGHAYGETKPLNRCVNDVECTDEEYLINRRTTFEIREKKKKR